MMRPLSHCSPPRSRRSGLTLLEITIAMSVIVTVLIASAGAFGSSVKTVNSARLTSRASVFVETVMEDLSAQDYDNLLTFNGNDVFDNATAARSELGARITVTQAAVGIRRIDVIVRELRTNQVLGRVATLRVDR